MKPNHDKIWLVPTDYEGGQLSYTWCDHPAPGEGMSADDSIEYVRTDLAGNDTLANRIEYFKQEIARLSNQVVDLLDERDALRAQVEQLRTEWEKKDAHEVTQHEKLEKLASILYAAPQQFLAEVRAQAYKQGFKDCLDAVFDTGVITPDSGFANQIRQQSQEQTK